MAQCGFYIVSVSTRARAHTHTLFFEKALGDTLVAL